MPYRKIIFTNQEIYHVVNQGVAESPVFLNRRDYQRMLQSVEFYRHAHPPLRFTHFDRLSPEEKKRFSQDLKKKPRLVEILAFCLMPNHFHFLLKQLMDKGVSLFMGNFQNSYAKYFNTKYKRLGSLFLSMFKAVRIETNEQLLHVSRYIHLNPSSSYLVEIKNLENYPWSSLLQYLNPHRGHFVNPNLILEQFQSTEDYRKFILDQAEYQRALEKIKHLVLE